MSAPEPVIHVRGLTRTFQLKSGPVHAVRGIDLTVVRGEILGFLGPNGAGKTTTLRMLTTLLPPSGGRAEIAGRDLLRDPVEVRRRIGYVAQSGGLDPACGVREELVTQGRLHRLTKAEARERAEELARDLGLLDLMDRPTAALSGGQRRRLEIALGLVNRPEVLFLDEPTTGLDPGSRAELWDLVRRVRAEHGATVVLTTHYLDEADALSDRIVVVDSGRIVAEGTPADLKTRFAGGPAASLQDAFLAITGRSTADEPIAI
ncbi:ABC transporter ATP-binding protein [Marinitenerispora sediminis]|uniref:ABC transporter ATP-binding protein n=1 Tax=Marinitenerispora sediminis TaxID=1931232 RepID=A0A368T963_9ACTN|nr:ATP-binding cassette domain-containing protein [Marinitenerispora sediminis]RCV49014.1 ABC transporter ATP-binding protein [Marinitenerispora sediminis]RCV51738.1 ABC transporter ATP-binding protein [Marinitenerispora sediminis]RCV60962.1 ABC transporter ATP-binding protein [Marinitenerispora sediminis]